MQSRLIAEQEREDNKFAQSRSQVKQPIELSSGEHGGRHIISIFLGTFKIFNLC
ncbi:hypothetical protein [Wolbachia endosymbiont of Litomosoides brasiliensis]|uniref:hypothetical protein n=1 Tax=Wolbachia endosymbiont of Litomosoides brasiliensis TaxID=1812117 RepID=UPI003979C978